MNVDIALDFGSSSTRIMIFGKDDIFEEPSAAAYDVTSGELIAFGKEAFDMVGRTSERIKIIYPIEKGVVTDFDAALAMTKYFLRKVTSKKMLSGRAVLNIPEGISDLEIYNLVSLVNFAGIKKVYLINTCKAALIGAGCDILAPRGRFCIDIGAGSTKLGVMSLGSDSSVRRAELCGGALDDLVIKYAKTKYNLLIGRHTARTAKEKLCSAREPSDLLFYKLKGRNIKTGLPSAVEISNFELLSMSENFAAEISLLIQGALNGARPEIVSDIYTNGIVITGGASDMTDLDRYIETRLDIKTVHPENSRLCVIKGCERAFAMLKNDEKLSPLRLASTKMS
ncbi:MAG: rod shape-determining protein [Clostridiales bacterium]|nr:rod shape-determining protein [Clostridiales bacterium]